MKKQSVIDQIEVLRDGTVQVRMTLEIVDDDGTILASAYHRAVLHSGDDVAAKMATINANLRRDGKEPVSDADIARLHRVVATVWTRPFF